MFKNFFVLSLIVFLFIAGCSRTTDKEYMVRASESIEQNNYTDAVSAYEELLKNYPESELAPEALIQLATVYHQYQVKNISQKESLEKAANLFKSVFEKYPDSDQAPQSLFMAGFIYANDLKAYNEATNTYNLFIEKFPDHELASSAKEELEFMGLTPEEILRKKIAVEK
jgi:TolA-binding protein